MSLATLAQLKAFRASGTTVGQTTLPVGKDAFYQDLLDRSTDQIQGFINRIVEAQDIAEWRTLDYSQTTSLKQYPIIRVTGAYGGQQQSLEVSCSTDDLAGASVSVGADAVVLVQNPADGSAATVDQIDFDDAPTVEALAAEINGLGDGWSAEVQQNCLCTRLWQAGYDASAGAVRLLYTPTFFPATVVRRESGQIAISPVYPLGIWPLGGPGIGGGYVPPSPTGGLPVVVYYRAGYETGEVPKGLVDACCKWATEMDRPFGSTLNQKTGDDSPIIAQIKRDIGWLRRTDV